MAELTVVNDDGIETAVLIDTDTWEALPIVAVGPNRTELLQQFVDSAPFDITLLKGEALMEGWRQFLSATGTVPNVEADASADGPVVASARDGNDAEAELADAEAAGATDVPGEQPADTDEEAAPPTREVTADCFNCNGTGTIEFGDGQPAVRCNVCKGVGTVTQTVPA